MLRAKHDRPTPVDDQAVTRSADRADAPSRTRRLWTLSAGLAALSLAFRAIAKRAGSAQWSTEAELRASAAVAPGGMIDAGPDLTAARLAAASPAAFRNGYLEAMSGGQVTGWAAPSGVPVTIVMDNAVVGTVISSLPRPDVEGAGYGPNTGWAFRLPPADPKRPHDVYARVGEKLLNGSASFGADAAAITDPARQIGGVRQGLASALPAEANLRSHPSVIFFADFSSDSSIKSQWTHADAFFNPGPSLPTINNPGKFHVDPATGIRMIEIPIDPAVNGTTGSSWYRLNATPVQELYCRYLMMIDPDVNVGMNELGVKLPGMAGVYERVNEWNYDGRGNRAVWSGRLEHGPQTAPGVYRLKWYWYGADHPVDSQDRGALMLCDCSLRAGQTYCIEQHIRLNTQAADKSWNSDGVLEVYVDGVRVYHAQQVKIRADARAMFQDIPFANFYHGGNTPPKRRIHYRFGGVVTAREYIGPPKRV